MSLKSWFSSLTKKEGEELDALSVEAEIQRLGSEVEAYRLGYMAKASTGAITGTLGTLPIDPRIEIEHDSDKEIYIAKEKKTGRPLRYMGADMLHRSNGDEIVGEFLRGAIDALHRLSPMPPPPLSSGTSSRRGRPPTAKGFVFPVEDGKSVVLPGDSRSWALIDKNKDGDFLVRTPDKTLKTENFFDAMLEIASYYGVKVDEDSGSKE